MLAVMSFTHLPKYFKTPRGLITSTATTCVTVAIPFLCIARRFVFYWRKAKQEKLEGPLAAAAPNRNANPC